MSTSSHLPTREFGSYPKVNGTTVDNGAFYYDSHIADPMESEYLVQYETNLERNKDERDAIQKKTFTKWVNKHLKKAGTKGRRVDDLFLDFQDGHNLIALLEVLSGQILPKEKGKLRFHKIQNVDTCLSFLRKRNVSEPWRGVPNAEESTAAVKNALLKWAQRVTRGYPDVNVRNFTNSWNDGLALNAILHRFRPDLINWREIRSKTNRERLDVAFHVAEREFGVTRLLDPEDVDPVPDELSVITYISSLYDAMPNFESIGDSGELSEYRNRARDFMHWTRRATQAMEDRAFPTHLVELRQLASELQRFRSEDLPPRMREKQDLARLYDELQGLFADTGRLAQLEPELRLESLDRAWNNLMSAIDEREKLLRDRVGHKGDIQDLLHRLHHEIGQTNEKLDHILVRIEDVESRVHVIPPLEMKEIVDTIVYDLNQLEAPIDGFFRDVETLKEARHPEYNDFYKQVFGLHQRRVAYLQRCDAQLVVVGHRSEHQTRIEEERYVQVRTQVFQFCEECIEWIEKMTRQLSDMEFVEDATLLEEMLERHRLDHRDIMDFRHQVDQCIARQAEVSNDDSAAYCELLSQLEKGYEELRELSTGRMLDLDSLLAFVRATTLELMWINEREEIEVTRDWSDINRLDTPMLQNYYRQLLHEVELREEQFNAVYNQGAALIKQEHPAQRVIEAYLTTMQAQWDWLISLTKCLEVHLTDATSLKEFLEEARNCEQWMERQNDLLESYVNRADITLEEGERMLKELDEIREMLDRYNEILITLYSRSQNLSPLWQRGERLRKPIHVHALCDYVDGDLLIRAGDECILLDNSDMIKWYVRVPGGVEGHVPSVVFRIPPPDERIVGYLQRLQAQFERLRKTWLDKHRRVRFNMVLNTIHILRNWDLKQFLAVDPDQREAILKAMNDDAQKLLSELDPNDPMALRLREELRLTNDHFYKLLQQAQKAQEPDASDLFDQRVVPLLQKLDEAWRTLNKKVHEPIPKDMEALEELILQHKNFEDALQALDSEVSMVQELFRQIPDPSPVQRARLDQLMERWEGLWDLSRMYVERLRAIEQVINCLAEANQIVAEHEVTLGSFDELPADLEKLRALHAQLVELQMVLNQQQPVFDQLAADAGAMRQHVARTRRNVADHPDVDRLEDDVQRVTVRWENITMQVMERLKITELACQIIMGYRPAYDTEITWLDRVERTINNLRAPEHLRPEEYQEHLDTLMAEYSHLKERTQAVESVNHDGGKYIREAKNYDSRLHSFRDQLRDYSPNLHAMLSRTQPAPTPGSRIVTQELEELNRRFAQLSSVILERHNVVQVLMQNWKRQQQDEEDRRRADEDARRRAEEEARRKAAEEAERLRRAREEEDARRRAAEAEAERLRRQREAEEARRREEEARRRAEEDRLRAEEEARRRAREEEEARRRAADAEADRLKRAREEEEARRRAAEAEADRLKRAREAEEARRREDEARRRAEEDRLRAEEEARRRAREEEEARRRAAEAEADRLRRAREAQEAEDARRRAEEERLRAEDEARRRRADEDARRRAEEEARRRAAEEDARRRAEEEEARRREEMHKSRLHVVPPKSPVRVHVPVEPTLNLQKGWQLGEGGMEGEVGYFDEVGVEGDRAKITEHEDEMQLYEEWTETRTQFYELEAIRHMQTGEILTFVEAVRQGLLDLHSGEGEFFDIVSGSRISLQEAVERGYVSQSFNDCLQTKYGIRDPSSQEELTLIEAVQRGIYDPDSRQLRDPATGELLPLMDAMHRGVISLDNVTALIKAGILKLPPMQLQDAIEQGTVNVETGMFVGKYSREQLPLREALRQGYIVISPPLVPMVSITLTDAIEQLFLDPNTGSFTDKNSSDKFTLRDAVSRTNNLINLNVREIINTQDRKRVTVNEAVVRNILNTRQANFTDLLQRQSMTLKEAYEKELIQKPLTLADVQRKDLVDTVGRIIDTGTKKRLTLLEAVAEGLVDPDVQHIRDPEEGDTISIAEALERGLLDPRGFIVDEDGGQQLTLAEAASREYIVEPVRHTIFDVKAIRNTKTNTMISFNEAVHSGVIVPQSERFVDLATNESFLLKEAAEKGLVDQMFCGLLYADSGIKGSHGQQTMPLYRAIADGIINTKEGHFVDKTRNQRLTAREAYERGHITLRGAMQLAALLNVHPSLALSTRVARTPKRGKRVRGFADSVGSPKEEQVKITLAEALKKGIVDARTQRYVDQRTKQEISLQDALNQGIIDPTNEWIVPAKGAGAGPTIQETTTEQLTQSSQVLPPKHTADGHSEESYTTIKRQRTTETTAVGGPGGVTSYLSITGGRGAIEVPVEGMHVLEAERKGMLDMHSGLFSIPNSERRLTLEETLNLGVIRSDNIRVKDSKAGGSHVPIIEALQRDDLMDSTGHVADARSGKKFSLREAIDAGLVVVDPESKQLMPVVPGGTKTIQFGVGTHPGSVVSFTPTGTATYEESHMAWTFDQSRGELVDEVSGEVLTLDEALRLDKVSPQSIYVKDALTERNFAYAEACRWGVIDPSRNQYVDKQNNTKISLREASIRGLINVVGIPGTAPPGSLQTSLRQETRKVVATKEAAVAGPAAFVDYSLHKVLQLGWYDTQSGLITHPDTKRQLTLKEAIMKGLFNPYESVVVNQATGESLSLLDAIQSGMVDATEGSVIHPKSKERINLKDAVERGIIRSGSASQSLGAALDSGRVDLSSGQVQILDGSMSVNLSEAISRGIIDPNSVLVKDPSTGDQIDFAQAVQKKVVDPHRGLLIDKKSGEAVSFAQALTSGFIRAKPDTTGAVARAPQHRPRNETHMITAPAQGQFRSPSGVPGREEIVDIGGGKQVLMKVVHDKDGVERGEYVDQTTGMKFTVQLHGDPYVTQTKTTVKSSAQVQAVELEPHAELIGIDKVRDIRTGRVMSLVDAQRAGLARVDKKGKQLTKSYAVFRSDISHAVKKGIVDPSSGERLSLQDAIHSRLIVLRGLQFYNPVSGDTFGLAQAANMGLVDVTLSEVLPKGVCNPANGERISLERAVELGIVNATNGQVMNPFTNEVLTWLDILKPVYASLTMEGVYDPRKGHAVPLTSAFLENLLDPHANMYTNPITGERLEISAAHKKGLIDDDTYQSLTKQCIPDWRSGRQISLLDAVRDGIVDVHTRTVDLGKGVVVPIGRASQEGKFPKDVGQKLKRVDKWTFAEALGKGLIDVASNQFTDPDTGRRMTITQALEEGHIDTGSVESLEGRDERNLSNVIESEEFDSSSGRIRDPRSNLYLTFRQAMDREIIDGDSLIYDTGSNQTVTLREAVEQGKIDANGKYVDTKSGARINLKDAVKAGLLALIASPMLAGQAVSEAVKRREHEGYRFKLEGVEDSSKGSRPKSYVEEESTIVKLKPKSYNPNLSLKIRGDESLDRWRQLVDDPQAIADKQFEFLTNLQNRGYNVEEPLLENPATGRHVSIKEAVETGLLDVLTGYIIHPASKRHYSIPKAVHMKMLTPNAAKDVMEALNIAVEEFYHTGATGTPPRSGGTPSGLLGSPTVDSPAGGRTHTYTKEQDIAKNYADTESRLDALLLELFDLQQQAADGLQRPGEQQSELRAKLQLVEELQTALLKLQGPMQDCIHRADQLTTDGAEVLSPDEFHNLRRHRDQLKDAYGASDSQAAAMIDRLQAAVNHREQFDALLAKFRRWLDESNRKVDDLRASVGDLDRSKEWQAAVQDLVDDIIAHRSDLATLEDYGRMVQDEIKGYIHELNQMRSSLPRPLPALDYRESSIRESLSAAAADHENLQRRCDALLRLGSQVETRAQLYFDSIEKAENWLQGAKDELSRSSHASHTVDPVELERRLNAARDSVGQLVQNEMLLQAARVAGDEFSETLRDTPYAPTTENAVQSKLEALRAAHNELKENANYQANLLQSTLAQSQGLQGSLDSFLTWLDEVEPKTTGSNTASLNPDDLQRQLTEQRVLMSDIDSHRQSLEACNLEAQRLFDRSPAGVHEALKDQLTEVDDRYNRLSARCQAHGEHLERTLQSLEAFLAAMAKLDAWLHEKREHLTSPEFSALDVQSFAKELDLAVEEVADKEPSFRALKEDGEELIRAPDVIDTDVVQEKLKTLVYSWNAVEELLNERRQQLDERRRRLSAYENQRDKVAAWLDSAESDEADLRPVALAVDVVQRQLEKVQPMITAHERFKPELDDLNSCATAYLLLTGIRAPQEQQLPVSKMITSVHALSPGSKSSSGFSSYEHLPAGSSLPAVQVEVLDLQQRYDLLGKSLRDFLEEAHSVHDLLGKHGGERDRLQAWLSERQERIDGLGLPVSKEEAQRMLDIAKDVAAELLKERVQFEDFKSNCHDITRLKDGSVPGLQDLHKDVETIGSQWDNLVDTSKAAQQRLNDAKDLYALCNSLRTWLAAKQRMMAVLGPIGSQPHHISQQAQQVQVLRDEFESQQPHMETLNSAGNALLQTTSTDDPDGQALGGKLADVNQKWEELVAKLEEREKDLRDAEKLADAFAAQESGLKSWLAEFGPHIDDLSRMSTSNDEEMGRQLAALQDMQEKLNDKSGDLATLAQTCEQLCDVSGDPSVKADLMARVQAVKQPFTETQKRLESLTNAMNQVRSEGAQFLSQVQKLLAWVQATQSVVDRQTGVSAQQERLQRQSSEFLPVYQDVLDHEGEVSYTMSKGSELVKKHGADPSLETALENLQAQWPTLLKTAKERWQSLEVAGELHEQFRAACQAIEGYMTEAEAKLQTLSDSRVPLDKRTLETVLTDIQDFRTEIASHKQEYKAALRLGEQLMHKTNADHVPLQDHMDRLSDRWEKLNADARKLGKQLEGVSHSLSDFNDALVDAKSSIGSCQDQLARADAQTAHGLDKLKAIQGDLTGVCESKCKAVGDAAARVKNDCPTGDATLLDTAVGNLRSLHDAVVKDVGDKVELATQMDKLVQDFRADAAKAAGELKKLNVAYDELGSEPRDLPAIDAQKDRVVDWLNSTDAAQGSFDAMRDKVDLLRQAGFDSDADRCQDQLDKLVQQLNAMNAAGNDRLARLERLENDLGNLHADIIEAQTGIRETMASDVLTGPVSNDVEDVRQQLDNLKDFKANLEPFNTRVEGLLDTGRTLAQSAAPGVDTSALEQELAGLRDDWNDLKGMVSDREGKLDSVLMGLGKYQDALGSLLASLDEMEELVAGQRPPSADFKVIKAQLAEQKMMERIIKDKAPSVAAFQKMAEQVVHFSDDLERQQLADQLEGVLERYDKLCTDAADRRKRLEDTLGLAEQWSDHLDPFLAWLDGAEKRLQHFDIVATDQEKLQAQIADHQTFHEEVGSKREELDTLMDLGDKLGETVSDEEGDMLDHTMQSTAARYDRLGTTSMAIGGLLTEVVAGVTALLASSDDLTAWLAEMELKLKKHDPISVFPEPLHQQTTELMLLAEEIAEHQEQVLTIVREGHELCKRTTGDEAIALQSKLDALRLQYSDLSKRADHQLFVMQEALPLAENYHDAHRRATEWLTAVESDLEHLDDASLLQQQELLKNLEDDIAFFRTMLEQMNSQGARLGQLSPGDGALTIEQMTSRLNRRFDAVCAVVQRRAERLALSQQRSSEVLGDMDAVFDWLTATEQSMLAAGAASCVPDVVKQQLADQRAINGDVLAHKAQARDLITAAKKLTRHFTPDDAQALQDKMELLKELADVVAQQSGERLAMLEQALPLAEHFNEANVELSDWLTGVETELENAPAVSGGVHPDQLRRQYEHNAALLQALQEYRPLADKLNKTGGALAALCSDEDAARVNDLRDQTNARLENVRDNIKSRAAALDDALQQTAQFTDRLNGMLNALASTAEQVKQAEPVAAYPAKILQQIQENCELMNELEQKTQAYEAVREAAADVVMRADPNDPAVHDVQEKLERLQDLWQEIQLGTETRGRHLSDTLQAAERFWDELQDCLVALNDLKKRIDTAPPPACDVETLQVQQDDLQSLEEAIKAQAPRVETCREAGQTLLQLVGEQEKPEVQQRIEELDQAWGTVTQAYAQRHADLIEAMENAMNFHEMLTNLLGWLGGAEKTFSALEPVSSDIQGIQRQIDELAGFKAELDQHAVDVEQLNQEAARIAESCGPEQSLVVRRPVADVSRRFGALAQKATDRQHQLEKALLQMGQFEQALDQFLDWMDKTEHTLDDIAPVPGDLKQTEIALAKHKVLQNDVHAHQSTVDSLNDAGRRLAQAHSDAPEATQEKLATLNDRWADLQQQLADKLEALQQCKTEAEGFSSLVHDLLAWLQEVEPILSATKPVGGLPETAQAQLDDFMVLYTEVADKKPQVEMALEQCAAAIAEQPENVASTLLQTADALEKQWSQVRVKADDRKLKLELALRDACDFGDRYDACNDWLTNAERKLASLQPPSRLLVPLNEQIEEHKALQDEIAEQRESINELDGKGTQLKYFAQKQDVIVIKNSLVTAQRRWDKVLARATERTRQLDNAFGETSQFFGACQELNDWIDGAQQTLHTYQQMPVNTADRIADQLAALKELNAAIEDQQAAFDACQRSGKALKDHAPKSEQPEIQAMLDALKDKWTTLSKGSRQRRGQMEEALVLSGQFKEAAQALLDWLQGVEPGLRDEHVLGDLDTVNALHDQHRNLLADFKQRQTSMDAVERAADNLLRAGDLEESAPVRGTLEELKESWTNVKALADERQQQLDSALSQAEQFHHQAHALLEWLGDVEMRTKAAAPPSEDRVEAGQQLLAAQDVVDSFDQHKPTLEAALDLGNEILAKCHPNAKQPMKHWLAILQARWDDVLGCAQQRADRLRAHTQALDDQDALLQDLNTWLDKKDEELTGVENIPLPEDVPAVEQLIDEHAAFQESLRARQPEVDQATKPKRAAEPTLQAVKKGGANKMPDKPKGNPKIRQVSDKWQHVWLRSMERQRRLQDMVSYLHELEKVKQFDFNEWRQRYMAWMNHNKSRVMDLFRRLDKNGDGKVTRAEFVDGILQSKFPTNRLEMNAVADIFDKDGDGYIDYKEFIAALRPERESLQPKDDHERIKDEVRRQVQLCTCHHRYKVKEVGEGKYKFGDSQKLRLVRILRSTVMVRVGGGWVALDEFLVKNDPCRAKGRTNLELREKFILPEGASQTMQAFRNKSTPRTPGTPSMASSGSGSVASSFGVGTSGPVIKIREKTERSMPIRRSFRSTGARPSTADLEVASITTPGRRPSDLLSPDSSYHRPASRGGSRPPSRAGSDISEASAHSKDSLQIGITPTRLPSLRKKQKR